MFCDNCGNKNEDGALFCGNCGQQQGEPAKGKSQTAEPAPQYAPPAQTSPSTQFSQPMGQAHPTLPPIRSYAKWFGGSLALIFVGSIFYVVGIISLFTNGGFGVGLLLGGLMVLTGAIINYVYYYYNFDDFKKLNNVTHGPFNSGIDGGVGLLLFIFISPVAVYLKYNQLHEHLTKQHTNETKVPLKGISIVGLFLIPFGLYMLGIFFLVAYNSLILLTIAGFIMIVIPFVFIYYESQWQSALNTHIINHSMHLKL